LEKQIIALDGGNQIKTDGQLNALILQNGQYSFSYVDDLAKKRIIKKGHQDVTNRVGAVPYPHYDVKVIDQEPHFTLCENLNLGIEQWVKNEYISKDSTGTKCKSDLSTSFLSVSKDESVSIINEDCSGYVLIKKENGDVGWIPRECFGLQEQRPQSFQHQ